MTRHSNIVKITLVIFVIIFILGVIKVENDNQIFMEKSVETIGEVIEIEETRQVVSGGTRQSREISVFLLHVSYIANDGIEYNNIIYTRENLYKKGDEIIIFYNPENPEESKIESRHKSGMAAIVYSILFLGLCICFLWGKSKRKNIDSN